MEGIDKISSTGSVAATSRENANSIEPSTETAAQTAAATSPSVSTASQNQPAAVVDISTSAQASSEAAQPKQNTQASAASSNSGKQQSENEQDGELTEEEKRKVEELKARDREVRAHEQAHLSALGAHKSGGPSYEYETGPDGKQYAVGGEVPVDVSPESEPEKTVLKMQTIQRAALAPAEPSSADRAVAAKAAQLESQARAEIASSSTENSEEGLNGEVPKAEASQPEESSRPNPAELFASDPVCPICGEPAAPDHSHTTAVA